MKSWVMACAWLVPPLVATAAPAGVEFECLVELAQVVELRSTVEGLIDKINVCRCDAVRRGQVLAELQSRAGRLAVESARFRSQMEGQIATAQSRIAYAT